MNISFINEKTGQISKVKVGWSWLLFFGPLVLFGIPLFLRRLTIWGSIALALELTGFFILDNLSAMITLFVMQLGLSIFLGIKGNELTAKNYLENDWIISNPDSQDAIKAKSIWGLRDI